MDIAATGLAAAERTWSLVVAVAAAGLVLAGWAAGASARVRPPRSRPGTHRLPPIQEVTTERLVIRRSRPDDLPALLSTIDDEVVATNGWTPSTLAELSTAISADRPLWGSQHAYAIRDQVSGDLVGSIIIAAADVPALGWWIAKEARGAGYATEAVRGIARAAFLHGVPALTFGTAVDNQAVQRLAVSIGATEVRRADQTLPNGRVDAAIYYVLRPEGATPA